MKTTTYSITNSSLVSIYS